MSQPKPNFAEMTIKQLKTYILAHREDEDAIHALSVRLRNEGTTGTVDEFLEQIKHQVSE
jgi:hypothetical protein